MHFHAFEYAPASDGAFIPQLSAPGVQGAGRRDVDLPAQRAVPSRAGVWPYHDHSPSMTESIPHGLYGAISILGRNERPPDRRFVVTFGEHLGFDSINGRAFIGNTPTFHAKVGETRRVGRDRARRELPHVPRPRAPVAATHAGAPTDTQTVGPGESFRVRWTEDASGTWYYHCHVESHQMNGMIGLYKVGR